MDRDLWLCVLDLAVANGWRPRGTTDPDPGVPCARTGAPRWEPHAYHLAVGQRIGTTDARELAAAARRGLGRVPEMQVPLTNHPFGDDHSLELIRGAAEGKAAAEDAVQGAIEILSGSPAREAAALLRFLRAGELRIYPEPESTR